jgi:NADH-quinone oxidoreductase subunit H
VFVFAVTSLTVYAIILGGWASNNKYSFLGGLRSSAQLISYEIPMGMSILGVVLFTGSLNLENIIAHQALGGIWGWNIWVQPLAFLLFLTSVLAECNRLPFDLPEAEQELIGGYHTEYSALKFGLFFLGEYTHVITTSLMLVALFFGGWHFPWIAEPGSTGLGSIILKLLVFLAKMSGFIVFYMLVRWTLPRFRFDQLMALAWKVMIPLALANVVCVMFVLQLGGSRWLLLLASAVLFFGAALLAAHWPKGRGRVLILSRGHEEVAVAVR